MTARANSNQALYLAKILLESWLQALEAEQLAATTVNQAFSPAVGGHLRNAYSWFLLEISDQEIRKGELPRSSAKLELPPEGRAVSGELRELAQLESSGFLAALLNLEASAALPTSSAGNLASSAISGPDYHEMRQWVESFEVLCERMRNSLDEY